MTLLRPTVIDALGFRSNLKLTRTTPDASGATESSGLSMAPRSWL
jgi:hypothetical protein